MADFYILSESHMRVRFLLTYNRSRALGHSEDEDYIDFAGWRVS